MSRRASFVSLAVAVLLVLTFAPSASASIRSPEHRSTDIYGICDPSHPYLRQLTRRSDGNGVPDLYFCTNFGQTQTVVVNRTTKVWYLQTPETTGYWGSSNDWDVYGDRLPLKVRVFREGVRRYGAGAGRTPRLTFEPGTSNVVPGSSSPDDVVVDQSTRTQFAWSATKLTINTLKKKAPGWGLSLLGKGSPMRNAFATCVSSAYSAALTLTDSEAPSFTYTDALGLRGSAQRCSSAIDGANSWTSRQGLSMTAEDLRLKTSRNVWTSTFDLRTLRTLRIPRVGRF